MSMRRFLNSWLMVALLVLIAGSASTSAFLIRRGGGIVTPPTITLSISLSNSTFTYSAPSSGSGWTVGQVTVTAIGGSWTGTLSLTNSGGAGGFVLSGTTGSPNLTCPSGGCVASGGPFSDFDIVATQSGASNSPLHFTPTISGVPALPTCNTPPIHNPNIAGDCLVSSDTSDQIFGPRANAAGFQDSLTFNGSGQILFDSVELVAGGICNNGLYSDLAVNGACNQPAKIFVCATPGNVGSNSHPWLTEGVAAWQPGTPAFQSEGTAFHPGVPSSFQPTLTFQISSSYQSTGLAFMTNVCPSGGGSTNSYFTDSVLGPMPSFWAATRSMATTGETLTVSAPPPGYPFWPSGENVIGPVAGYATPPSDLTVNFNSGASFGYIGFVSKGWLDVDNNGTTINGGSCFWMDPNSSGNADCIALDAGIDLTVNNFHGQFSGDGLHRGNFRQGIITISNTEFENAGWMGGSSGAPGFSHGMYLGTGATSGFDTLVASNLYIANVLSQAWNLKLRTPNSSIDKSAFIQTVNNGSAATHGPIDFPCGGTHSLTNSVIETNEYSFNSAISGQSSSFLVSAYEEASTNVATTVGGAPDVLQGTVCETVVGLPTYGTAITATITGPNTFTTTTNPTLFSPWVYFSSYGGPGMLTDLGASGLLPNGPVPINHWTGPVGGVYTVTVGQDAGSCYFPGEGTLPLSSGVGIYSCFSASSGSVTLYPISNTVTIATNTPTTASVTVPINPAQFGFAVGDTLTDNSNGMTITGITGSGPYTIAMSCAHPSFNGGSNCIFPLTNLVQQYTSVSSGTYNSTTGAVSLTLGSDIGLTNGSSFTVQGLFASAGSGAGNIGNLDGTYNATSGTGGTTLNYTAPTAQGTITIGSSGGNAGITTGSFANIPACASTLSTTGVGCPDVLNKQGPVQFTASTTGSGCDGTNTLCGIAYNPVGMRIYHGRQILGSGIAAQACMVAAQIDYIYPKAGKTGTGFISGDVGKTITLVGGTFETAAQVTIDTVTSGAITAAHITTGGVYTSFVTAAADSKTFTQGTTTAAGTGAQFQFPHPSLIVTGTGPYTLRLAQNSGANCINSSVTNQVYQTITPINITWDHDLIGWDGTCVFQGTCSILNLATTNSAWQTTSLTNSLLWTDTAAYGPGWTTGPGGTLVTGMTDGGGNIYCNNRTDLTTSPQCAIPPFTAANFTAGISSGNLTVNCGVGCMSIQSTGSSYNSTSGQVTLNVSQSGAIPYNWGTSGGGQGAFTISNITGTGTNLTSLNGNWFVASGTTGNTIIFQGPPGLGSLTITGGSIDAPGNAAACQPGMFVWDQASIWHTGIPGRMIAGTSILSGSAPNFLLYIPPGGVITTDITSGTQMACGWGTPSSSMNATIASGGAMTINSNLKGSVHAGDYLADIFSVLPANVRVLSGSGTTWQTNYAGGGISAEQMVSVRSDAPLPVGNVVGSVTLSASAFTYAAPANTLVGTVNVTMSSGTFSGGTLSTSGANTGHFVLAGTSVMCSSSGCPSSGGPFTDFTITATPATGTAGSGTPTITGSAITISAINAPSTYPESGSASQTIGPVTVTTSGGTPNVTVALSGVNSQHFQLVGSPGAYNLLCAASGGCPASGTFTDYSLTATQGPASLGPVGQSITGATGATIIAVRLNGNLLASSSYLESATTNLSSSGCLVASGCVGNVAVYMSDYSAFPFSGLSLSGTGSSSFTLRNFTNHYTGTEAQIMCNTTCPASGTFNFNIVATPTTGSPVSLPITLTGVSGTLPAVTAQIHNAPGWAQSTSYSPSGTVPKTRVVSGVGYTANTTPNGGTFNPGSALAAYELTSGSSCTSASSGFGPAGSGTPNTGSSISDGTCTWKYLSTVDYISVTGWGYDDQKWASGKTYVYGDIVTSGTPLLAYGNNAESCVSSVAPNGTSTNGSGPIPINGGPSYWGGFGTYNWQNNGDGCKWIPLAEILYSSQLTPMVHPPHQTYLPPPVGGNATNWTSLSAAMSVYTAQLWNDALYQPGAGIENSAMMDFHNSAHGEAQLYASGGPCFTAEPESCQWWIEPAPPGATTTGEGFANSLTASTPLTGIDPTKGVTIKSTTTNIPGWTLYDARTVLNGLQIQATAADAVVGVLSFGDYSTQLNNILDGGNTTDTFLNAHAVTGSDTGSLYANNLIIARGSTGITAKYPAIIVWNTIVCPGGACDAGVMYGNEFLTPEAIVANNAIFGFHHAAAGNSGSSSGTPAIYPPTSGPWSTFNNTPNWANFGTRNNVTDAPNGDSGLNIPWVGNPCTSDGGSPYPTCSVRTLPNSTYGSSSSSAFVSFGGGSPDYRPSPSGPLVGAGFAFGDFRQQCLASVACPPLWQDQDTPDFLGVARPHNGHYTVGAESEP